MSFYDEKKIEERPTITKSENDNKIKLNFNMDINLKNNSI